ncbi:unnamed protein product [Staurois parvus]|uniref:Uncharacterized protein n=1 Tax=Staurois parvus TaxID=386267 RepID=A0ABN9ATM8_9NEOB|nr:unnamed protein product [Staurois parvus]
MGPRVLTHTQTTPKKAYERYQGHLMGPPTDPGPSGIRGPMRCAWYLLHRLF